MKTASRRFALALLTAVLSAFPVHAGTVAIARGSLGTSLGGAAAPIFTLGGITGSALLAPNSMLPLMPMLSALPAPILSPAAAVVRPMPAAPAARVAPVLAALAVSGVPNKNQEQDAGARFDGGRSRSPAPVDDYIVNDEGVQINGRAAAYYKEVRRMVELYKGKINLAESLDVMDDAYGDVLAKVSAVAAVAKGRGLSQENTHLEETLLWIDGVLTDGAKKVAVHTHRVYFHHAKNPKSEIAEGNRRVDAYIKDAEVMFARGGKAEMQMGKLNEAVLVFDARGYQEIKDHILKRGAEVSARTKGRITFQFLDEIAPLPTKLADVRAKLNDLAKRYHGAGLSKIYEGVIYSRYVGLLLELKTLEHYYKLGYKILQSGRELFDENGMYVTELDAVIESPEGRILLVEAKSARVGLPKEEVLRDKVVYKLATYKTYRAQLEAMIGKTIDEVVFSVDIGLDPAAESGGRVTESIVRKRELVEYLRSKGTTLSQRYGYPVSFLFLQGGPQVAPPR